MNSKPAPGVVFSGTEASNMMQYITVFRKKPPVGAVLLRSYIGGDI